MLIIFLNNNIENRITELFNKLLTVNQLSYQ